MLKKTVVFTLLICSFMFPKISYASMTSVEYKSSDDTYYLYSNLSNVDYYVFKNHETGSTATYDKNGDKEGKKWINPSPFRCNTSFTVKYYDSAGKVIDEYEGKTTKVKNEPETCKSSTDEPDPPPADKDNCGCIFNTPGWGQYMGKVDEIINKIPTAPNWDKVAGKFRDKIVPKMTDDMGDMLGKAPSKPSKPSTPTGPSKPDMPKKPELNKPKGKDGIKDSGFTDDDIKDESPKIDEREDPTDGFDIDNPVDKLPSQDEFKKHKPDEGEVELPDKPDEPKNEQPDDPEEPKNPVPDPGEVDGKAPSPDDSDVDMPDKPEEPDIDVPSSPKDDDNHAPTPGDLDGKPPIPDDNKDKAPTPNKDSGKAPIPGKSNFDAPIPKKDNDTAPIPGGG